MKHKLLPLTFLLLFAAGAMAKDKEHDHDSERTMALSISPVSLIFGSANVLFQYNLGSFISLTLPAGFAYYWPIAKALEWAHKGDAKLTSTRAPISVSGGLGARIYPTGKGMNSGIFAEPRFSVSYSQFGASASGQAELLWTRVTVSPMIYFGWDWFTDWGFYSSLGAGIGYGYDVKSETTLSPSLRDAVKMVGRAVSLVPNPDSRGKFDWDLEFKLGFAW